MLSRTMLAVAVISALPLSGQASKQPWAYTVEERIVLRTSAELARQRIRERSGEPTAAAKSTARDAQIWVDSFDGQTHPELFLPHQVFDELIKLAFLSSPRTAQVVRDGFMSEVLRHGLPTDFWQRLESISAPYSADYWAVRDLLVSTPHQGAAANDHGQKRLAMMHAAAFRSRAEAFAVARKEFGRDRFDRFLYEVIAVGMFSSTDRLPEPELLRHAERGCR